MTKKRAEITKSKAGSIARSLALLVLILIYALKLSGEVASDVLRGIRLAAYTVIPTSLPFMVLSDFYRIHGRPEEIPILPKVFSAMSGIAPIGTRAFVCGNISGFPIGAKMAAELYRDRMLDKKSAEILAPLSNNSSIPFLLFAVGDSMFGSRRAALFLLISVYLSCLLSMLIFRQRQTSSPVDIPICEGGFSFVDSVKNAGVSCIGIGAFIAIFFALVSIVRRLWDNVPLFFVSIIEVTSALSAAAATATGVRCDFAVCGFALGFGGLSVMLQSAIFTREAGLSQLRYLQVKLVQGALCFAIAYILFPFI